MSEAEEIVEWLEIEVPELMGHIHPIRLPASPAFPAVTYQLISEEQDPIQDGPGLAQPRYRFKVWTATFAELDAIVLGIKAAFNVRLDGPFRSVTVEGSFEDYDALTNRWWRVVDVLGWQPA